MLNEFLVANAFGMMLVFARIGSAVMLLPGFGEAFITPRVRLSIALGLCVILYPVLAPALPKAPSTPLGLMILIIGEVLVGLFIGGLGRIIMSTLHTMGMIVSMQSGLGSAFMFDFNQESQGTSIGTFFSTMGMVLLFSANLHHMMIRALGDSYTLFTPGVMPPMDDIANHAAETVNKIFLLAFEMSAPITAVTLLMYVGAGVLARLMPTMPVFFVIIPIQMLVAFIILTLTLSASMLWYLSHFDETMFGFTAPLS